MSTDYKLPRYETLQPEYNLYDRAGYEKELEPLVQREQIGVIGYYALASGFLSGKYRTPADAAKSPARGETVVKRYLNPRGLRILQALDDVASKHGASAAQIALAGRSHGRQSPHRSSAPPASNNCTICWQQPTYR